MQCCNCICIDSIENCHNTIPDRHNRVDFNDAATISEWGFHEDGHIFHHSISNDILSECFVPIIMFMSCLYRD